MRSATTTLTAGLLGVLLGALGMWLVMPREVAAPSGGAVPAPTDSVRGPRMPEPVPETTHLGGQTPPGARSPAPDATAALAAAVEALELAIPEGRGRITGHVRTKDGAPLAGAVVRGWTPWDTASPRRSDGAPALPSVVEGFRTAALHAKWTAGTQREARSGADGSYVLADLVDAEYSLSAWAKGYELRQSGRGRAFDGGVVDFVASPVLTVPISVLAPDGSSPARASVRWSLPKGGGGGGAEWTSSDPEIAIEPGTWNVTASIGEELRSKPVPVTVGSTPGPVVLRLEARNVIQGTVQFDADDKAWTYAFVTSRRRGAVANERAGAQGARPPDWSFRIEDLEPGDYDVSVALTEHAPLATEQVHVSGGTAKVTLTVPRLGPAQVLEARVQGPDGTALSEEDVSFGLTERTENSSTGIGTRSVRRRDGTFLIPLSSPRAVAQGNERDRADRSGSGGRGGAVVDPPPPAGPSRWFLVVRSKAHGSKELEFNFGVTQRVEVTFE